MDFLKENWFVVLIAAIMIGFVSYFIYDQNKDNVTVKTVNGQDVVATMTDTNITAEQLYEAGEPYDDAQLFAVYKNAVIDQAIETTDALKEDAKTTQQAIVYNAKLQSEYYEEMLTAELASYGYQTFDQLYDYCLTIAKEAKLDSAYIDSHYDELKEKVLEANPRIVSIITMAVTDPENLTDEEKKKQENIDAMIESDSFAKAATTFSEDTGTAGSEGKYGYIDSSTTALDSAVLSAALEAKKGETTDWIQVIDSTTGSYYLYKVMVDETDLDTIYKDEDATINSSVMQAFITANPSLKIDAIEEAASKLDIQFESDTVKEKIEQSIKAARGTTEEEVLEETIEEETEETEEGADE